MPLDLNVVLQNCLSWCEIVAQVQRSYFRGSFKTSEKSHVWDLVTEVDHKSEQILIEKIKLHYPTHAILSEEAGYVPGSDSDYLWVIDPLDGTNNFVHGLGIFAISVALQFKGESVLGVVSTPCQNEVFSAQKGKGAFLNNKKIKVAAKTELAKSLVSTSMPFETNLSKDQVVVLHGLLSQTGGVRRFGAAAYELCAVAAGFLDLYFENGLKRWDVAAGGLILAEAGGKGLVHNHKNSEAVSILVSNDTLLAKVKPVLWPLITSSVGL